MPRVLFVSTVSELTGGAERSLLELACALARLGWRPALATWQTGSLVDAFRNRGLDAYTYRDVGAQPGSPFGGATLGLPKLRRIVQVAVWWSIALRPIGREIAWLQSLIEKQGFALVHSNCDLSIPAASGAARRAGVPFVAHVRDVSRHWLHPRVVGSLRRADMVLVASRDMARHLGTRSVQPRVVANPVGDERLVRAMQPDERDRWRAELGVRGRFALAIVGRLDPQKRVELALRAILALPHMGTPVTLLVAGQGSPAFEEQLKRSWLRQRGSVPTGFPHDVRWLGHRPDVPEWLPAVDALIMPSRREAFGRALVEGMLAGLPVVATRDGAGPELLDDGRTGLLVAADDSAAMSDAIVRLATAPELRSKLGQAARADALKRFSPVACASMVADLYQQLLADPRRAS